LFFQFPQKIGRIEEERHKNSEDLAKTLEKLEEWKKFLEKENNLKLQKIFSFIFHRRLEEWKKRIRENSEDLAKPLEKLEERKKFLEKENNFKL
jgi:cell fate (sporulation/competence/biofilm development) regulator YlbF (YheA/YmcA/DUF963 family)